MYCECSPRLIGCHVSPPSSVRNAPAAEMAMNIRLGSLGSRMIVCRHMPPAPGCQCGPGAVAAQPGEFLPRLPAIGRAEQGGVLDPGVNRVRIGQRRFQMPDALELPGMRRAVVPLVSAGNAVVYELVAHRLPGLAAIVGALDQLPEPAARLRRIQPVRVNGRSLDVVHLPTREMRAADVPLVRALPSDVRTNAPLRVPTSTRTLLILCSF